MSETESTAPTLCIICQDRASQDGICIHCQRTYPPALIKAVGDPFDYALRLVTGEIFRFTSATIHGEYVTLEGFGGSTGETLPQKMAYPFPRGLDVRVSAIVWCADAPEGS
jgi:hypothetical protein